MNNSSRLTKSILVFSLVALYLVLFGASALTTKTYACAFGAYRPAAYEGGENRLLYIHAIDAAANNLLFPQDARFALDRLEQGTRYNRYVGGGYVPPTLIKSIAWVETKMTMATKSTAWNGLGDSVISFDCGHGVMQVTTGMINPLGENSQPSDAQALISTHFTYNIAKGVKILGAKWNNAPQISPIVGTDTDSQTEILENWYYATWAYNGFTGYGSYSSNHPLDPSFTWPRSQYSCSGTQSHNEFPYQELVWGCIKNPPTINGTPLWSPIPITLPDLFSTEVNSALSPGNFYPPYANMDIKTPAPWHTEVTPANFLQEEAKLIGRPILSVPPRSHTIRMNSPAAITWVDIPIRNSGSGLSTWRAKSSVGFLVVNPPAGIAPGDNLTCTAASCDTTSLRIEVNPTLLPASYATGVVSIWSPNEKSAPIEITINVVADFELTFPGSSKNSD
tara:strand:- start:22 stop:1371 length:1350 start_codon:yes stop_codon:yes gene_type:complete